jgi:predicted NBD/HSP70 family sugar kinase
MSAKLNSAITVIGIDIGKNSFHVVGLDRRGAIVLRQRVSWPGRSAAHEILRRDSNGSTSRS